jgi:hypothetical protein
MDLEPRSAPNTMVQAGQAELGLGRRASQPRMLTRRGPPARPARHLAQRLGNNASASGWGSLI